MSWQPPKEPSSHESSEEAVLAFVIALTLTLVLFKACGGFSASSGTSAAPELWSTDSDGEADQGE